ncbi:MAG: hypothetical protein ACLP01_02040 [Solirubrobacteraceae bacterium]
MGPLPPLQYTNAAPDWSLRAILGMAPTPSSGPGRSALGAFDRWPWEVLILFSRYIRIIDGEHGTRVAFFPALICNPQRNGIPKQTSKQAIMMVALSLAQPHAAILGGTAAMISDGAALPGTDLDKQQGWIQAVIVPDGVATVRMQFTPPFLHHYTVQVPIHDNIGIAVRKPDYTPTIVSWYAADGRLIRTFVDRPMLRYDNCLATHATDCNG